MGPWEAIALLLSTVFAYVAQPGPPSLEGYKYRKVGKVLYVKAHF